MSPRVTITLTHSLAADKEIHTVLPDAPEEIEEAVGQAPRAETKGDLAQVPEPGKFSAQRT
jgi:hypothetical protein